MDISSTRETFVSYEVARLLKEKGFDWGCCSYWCIFPNGDRVHTDYGHFANHNGNETDKFVSRPTQAVACRWLREEKNIYVTAIPDIGNSLRFYPAIYVIKGEIPEEYWFEYINSVVAELNKSYNKPQQAVEAALQYCLTNLI